MSQQMLHIVDIAADPAAIYAAVSTASGLRSFWTADADAEATVGSTARFGFPQAPVDVRMEVTALEPDAHVGWTCLGDFPYWAGTFVDWSIADNPGAPGSLVTFRHAGWANDYPDAEYGLVNYVWGQIVGRLKAYAETGVANPVYPPAA
jgi:uncharacterized protein YndB with AHSA1/START domain